MLLTNYSVILLNFRADASLHVPPHCPCPRVAARRARGTPARDPGSTYTARCVREKRWGCLRRTAEMVCTAQELVRKRDCSALQRSPKRGSLRPSARSRALLCPKRAGARGASLSSTSRPSPACRSPAGSFNKTRIFRWTFTKTRILRSFFNQLYLYENRNLFATNLPPNVRKALKGT